MKIEGVELTEEHVGREVAKVDYWGYHKGGTIERCSDDYVYVKYQNGVFPTYAENLVWVKDDED